MSDGWGSKERDGTEGAERADAPSRDAAVTVQGDPALFGAIGPGVDAGHQDDASAQPDWDPWSAHAEVAAPLPPLLDEEGRPIDGGRPGDDDRDGSDDSFRATVAGYGLYAASAAPAGATLAPGADPLVLPDVAAPRRASGETDGAPPEIVDEIVVDEAGDVGEGPVTETADDAVTEPATAASDEAVPVEPVEAAEPVDAVEPVDAADERGGEPAAPGVDSDALAEYEAQYAAYERELAEYEARYGAAAGADGDAEVATPAGAAAVGVSNDPADEMAQVGSAREVLPEGAVGDDVDDANAPGDASAVEALPGDEVEPTAAYAIPASVLEAFQYGAGSDTRAVEDEHADQTDVDAEAGTPTAARVFPVGYEPAEADAPAYDPAAYDAPGYDAPGYDAPGYDAPGYDAPGYDAPAYDAPAYDPAAYDGTEVVPAYDAPPTEAWAPPPSPMPLPAPPPPGTGDVVSAESSGGRKGLVVVGVAAAFLLIAGIAFAATRGRGDEQVTAANKASTTTAAAGAKKPGSTTTRVGGAVTPGTDTATTDETAPPVETVPGDPTAPTTAAPIPGVPGPVTTTLIPTPTVRPPGPGPTTTPPPPPVPSVSVSASLAGDRLIRADISVAPAFGVVCEMFVNNAPAASGACTSLSASVPTYYANYQVFVRATNVSGAGQSNTAVVNSGGPPRLTVALTTSYGARFPCCNGQPQAFIVPGGQPIEALCQRSADMVAGSTIWNLVEYNGQRGWVPNAYTSGTSPPNGFDARLTQICPPGT